MTSVDQSTAESEYVHSIYSRLATYQKQDKRSSQTSHRIWPRVRHFVESLPPGCVVVDVGCGEAKYTSPSVFVMGIDACSEVLLSVKQKSKLDLMLGDAVTLPLRDGCVDAILNVSVIHHLSTVTRRRQALKECARCLRVGGQMLLYTWAFEQPNGVFPSQDVLVPWNLHETVINGRLPKVKFHMNSTKEQRIIEASIPVNITSNCEQPTTSSSRWFSTILNKVNTIKEALPSIVSLSPRKEGPATLPAASPQFLPTTKSLISGIRRWSPMLGRRLASLIVPVEEQFAEELSQTILRESVTEAMATLREVTFYRFYHVFRKGELEDLVESTPSLRILSSTFEHGNWCVVAEKVPENYVRI
ncbi:unnamed protein product [Caenorhabditis auriculariae]|uniref:Methyltransferase type 11 domain-containing protein n=1 Tax=Caenorhabditis auriculariae TaxID=2777116 RepID=A0A8S1GXW2_9PELO|nr:unnamed protein product [Caenorhabditis auriculariae]